MRALTKPVRFGPGAAFADSADLCLVVGCQSLALLTLITHACAANILSSDNLELATIKQPVLAYPALWIIVTANGIIEFG